MIIQALALMALSLAAPARADVSDSGNLTIGGQGIIQGTMTVQGAGFSVGGTTFSVAGGSVTLGGRLNAAAAGILWADNTTSTTASAGSSSGSAGGDLTGTYPNPTWNPAHGITAATATFTGNAFSVGNSTFAVKDGKVGIGVSSPTLALDVSGATHITGDVNIGTVSVLGKLVVDNAAATTRTLYLTGTSNTSLLLSTDGNSGAVGAFQEFYRKGSRKFYVGLGPWSGTDVYEIASPTTLLVTVSSVTGAAWFVDNVSALSFTDRTPYPESKKVAYDAVLSMGRSPGGGVNHEALHPFVRHDSIRPNSAMHGKGTVIEHGRDLSATVSAQNEVIKDLIKRIETLEAKR